MAGLDGNHPVGEAGHNTDHENIDNKLVELEADISALGFSNGLKASKIYVDQELALKADADDVGDFVTATELTNAVSGKVSTDDPRLANERTPSDLSVTTGKLASKAVTRTKVSDEIDDLLDLADTAQQINETVNNVVTAGTAQTIPSPTSGTTMNRYKLTAGTCTFTLPTPVVGQSFTFTLVQDATGGRSYALSGTYSVPGGALPSLSTTPNAVDRFAAVCDDITEGWAIIGPPSSSTSLLDAELLFPEQVFPGGGEAAMSQYEANQNGVSTGSGVLKLMFFTAKRTEAITKLRAHIGSSAYTSPTSLWLAVYTVDGSGNGTRIAVTNSATTGMTSTDSGLERTLTTTFNKVVGQRYAYAYLAIAGSGANMVGTFLGATSNSALSGRLAGNLVSQSSMPTSFVAGDVTNTGSCIQLIGLP